MKINEIKQIIAEHQNAVFAGDVVVIGFVQEKNPFQRHAKPVTKVRVASVDTEGNISPWVRSWMPSQIKYVRFNTIAELQACRAQMKAQRAEQETARQANVAALENETKRAQIRQVLADRLGVDRSCVSVSYDRVTITLSGVQAAAIVDEMVTA